MPPQLFQDTHKTFEPKGAALDLMLTKEPEVLIEGPAGTGKSRAALEKLYIVGNKYKGARLLMVRKTRKSMTQSTLVTWETKVLTGFPKIKLHRTDQEYRFPNTDAKLIVSGMDDPEKIKSMEYDIIYVNEGTELTEEDYEILRTRNRNWAMPYQQTIVDCNPDAPAHWLNRRAEAGKMLRLLSRHEDNPAITPEYLALLDSLTGHRYLRLRCGLWVAAEGLVYPEFERTKHVVGRTELPKQWPTFISVDFGYRDPFVAQFWKQDPRTGMLVMFHEIYFSERTVQNHAHTMYELARGHNLQAIVTDHDAEDRATLSEHWHPVSACSSLNTQDFDMPPLVRAEKDIRTGIEAIRTRLNMKFGLALMEGSLVEFDQVLKESSRPTNTIDEFLGYIWDTRESKRLGTVRHDKPLDKDNHGMDALRYLVKYVDSGAHGAWGTLMNEPANMQVVSSASTHRSPDDILSAWEKLLNG